MSNVGESRVDTKLFDSTASAIGASTKELDLLCQEWAKQMGSLRSEWQGDTSDDIKNTVEQVKKSAADLLANLSAYPGTLREIAGIYDKTESSIKETGRSLTFDGGLR